MSPIALSFFDFDDTLYRGVNAQGYLIFDFSSFLERRKIFRRSALKKLRSITQLYRQGKLDRRSFALQTVQTYYHGLAGQLVEHVKSSVDDFWNEISPSEVWFPYSVGLVSLMNNCTRTILISGSPIEPLEYVKETWGFAEVHATRGDTIGGLYTGACAPENELATGEAKERLVERLVAAICLDAPKSFAFGDSLSDLPLLSIVNPQNSFVLGAGKELTEIAQTRGWITLNHDDDVLGIVRDRVRELFPDHFE